MQTVTNRFELEALYTIGLRSFGMTMDSQTPKEHRRAAGRLVRKGLCVLDEYGNLRAATQEILAECKAMPFR